MVITKEILKKAAKHHNLLMLVAIGRAGIRDSAVKEEIRVLAVEAGANICSKCSNGWYYEFARLYKKAYDKAEKESEASKEEKPKQNGKKSKGKS